MGAAAPSGNGHSGNDHNGNGNGHNGNGQGNLPRGEEVRPATAAGGAPSRPAGRPQAVEAYCLELCGSSRMQVPVSEVLLWLEAAERESHGEDSELLRVTRSIASGYAPLVLNGGEATASSRPPTDRCVLTPPRLARSANGELDRFSRADLEQHLADCVVCHAVELRQARAERAFAAVIGTVSLRAPEAKVVAPEAKVVAPVEPAEPAVEIAQEPEPAEIEELEPLTPATPEAPAPIEPDEPAPIEPDEPALAHPRGLVVLPAPAETAVGDVPAPFIGEPAVRRRTRALRDWRVLIVTLIVGVVVVVIIALLWSGGSSAPNPKSLPPATASAAAVLGTNARRLSRRPARPASHRARKHGAAAPVRTVATDQSSAPAAPSPAPNPNGGSSAPARPAPPQPQPQPHPSPSNSTGTSTIANLNSELPQANAPTKSIGSMLPGR